MKKFEYKTGHVWKHIDDFRKYLNDMGYSGWELISIKWEIPGSENPYIGGYVIFKREV